MDHTRLQAEVLTLRRRIRLLSAIVRLLIALLRVLDVRLDRTRLSDGAAKSRLLRAIDRAQGALSLRGALRVLHLSPSRYHQWRRAEQVCELDDKVSCPHSTPTRRTATEILTIMEMVESPEYRHVPTGRLAILAQRLGRVFAAPATWYRLAHERGWRRPRAWIRPTLHWDRTASLLASMARRVCARLRRACMSSTRTRKSRIFVEIARRF